MESYYPDPDIRSFRDYRLPWVRVELPERTWDGSKVQPIAYNARDKLVLLHHLDDGSGYALGLYKSDSPDGPYSENWECAYENIWHFDSCW